MRYLLIFMLACGIFGCDDDSQALGTVGSECSSADDCLGGVCIDELGPESADPITFEGGYCSSTCAYEDLDGDGNIGYEEYTGCGDDGMCLIYDDNPYDEVPSEESYCFQKDCVTDWDCRDSDYICYQFGYPPFTPSMTACVPLDVRVPQEQERYAAPAVRHPMLTEPIQ